MHFTISSEHRSFFLKNGYIAFEDLLKPDEFEGIKKEVENKHSKKFDLFRDSTYLKKVVQHLKLASLIRELFEVSLIRIGFDSYLPSPSALLPKSLESTSSAKPLVGALLIPLSLDHREILVVSCQKALSWKEILKEEPYYLIAYAGKHALYYLENNDPYTHAWKKLGYVFGDPLNEAGHPVCR